MIKRKNIRERGKIKFSEYFKEFKIGDRVAIVREQSFQPKFPVRIQGLVGTVQGQRGQAYLIMIQEGGIKKIHIIKPIHLKQLR